MAKKSDTVRYSAKQIERKFRRGVDRTDWAKIERTTAAEIEASITADPDDIEGEPDWTKSVIGLPVRKDPVTLRIDHNVLEWFRTPGKGYQTMMNNVLRAFVQTRRRRKQP